ncbi:MAG: hypothetical protein Q4E86_00765 [Lachnospiraceae bacterium]|nr:hypothetical protein [Lachnospiraceae bacterium]MDO5551633.1 hypothetical protein [Lachnospiraceae bacterium]
MRKSFRFLNYLIVCMILTLSSAMPAFAHLHGSDGSMDSADYLRYQAKDLSWKNDQITLTGSFVNVSADRDIYDICNASIAINDSAGNPAISTSLNSKSLEEVLLGPGETWEYTIVRTIENFDPDSYNIKAGFTAKVSCDFSIRKHASDCTFCASRENPSFQTEDTMTEEEWQMLLAKLKAALNDSDSSSSTSSAQANLPSYYPYIEIEAPKQTCVRCGGTGRRVCTTCDGTGTYRLERGHGMVWTGVCSVCHGHKTTSCTLCFGKGSY